MTADKKLITDLNLGPRETRYLTNPVSTGRSLADVITEALRDQYAAEKQAKIQALANKMWPNGSPSERSAANTEETIRAQIKRFDEVLADPDWEWDAMVEAALEVRDELKKTKPDPPEIQAFIACATCREGGINIGDWYTARTADEVTPEMIHKGPTPHDELRTYWLEKSFLEEPMTLAETAQRIR